MELINYTRDIKMKREILWKILASVIIFTIAGGIAYGVWWGMGYSTNTVSVCYDGASNQVDCNNTSAYDPSKNVPFPSHNATFAQGMNYCSDMSYNYSEDDDWYRSCTQALAGLPK